MLLQLPVNACLISDMENMQRYYRRLSGPRRWRWADVHSTPSVDSEMSLDSASGQSIIPVGRNMPRSSRRAGNDCELLIGAIEFFSRISVGQSNV